jgi:hypothetical protein
MLVAMTDQVHDTIVWRGQDYQLVGVDGLMVAAGTEDLLVGSQPVTGSIESSP